MLVKIPRAPALRAMIVVSPILCSPAYPAAADSSSERAMPIGDDEE